MKTFQWIKGDDAGKVVKWDGTIEEIDGVGNFLVFSDSTRANESLLNDFILEIANENDLILLPEPKPLPRENNPPMQRVQLESAPISQQIEKPVSPMHRLLAESRKTKTTVNISLVSDMPPTDLMRVLADSYDDGEQQILEYISANLNVEDLKAQVAKQVWLAAFSTPTKRKRNPIHETA
jgi:hypothetical protein